jgi:flavin-dependent dehydrogenase
MPVDEPYYHTCIIGGGLAGLSLAIQLSKKGFGVLLIEKESYPFHRVCGEYISMESWPFLEGLGVPLTEWNLPRIQQLTVSAPNGNSLQAPLPLGGFGISRYKLDEYLYQLATSNGATVLTQCKVEDVTQLTDHFIVNTTHGVFRCLQCCGSFGKRSNLDVKWKRKFAREKKQPLQNFIGIKYHVQTQWPVDTIGLHNFEDGYCGISRIEDQKYCCCYLTTAAALQKHGGNIALLEQQVLAQNPALKHLLSNSTHLYKSPLAISQISFNKKEQFYNGVLLLGDAAGMITPLCGNGMSMALHSSKIAAGLLEDFFNGDFDSDMLQQKYQQEWKRNFSKRLLAGRLVQRCFGKKWATNLLIFWLKKMPAITRWIIRQTHGQPF